MVAQTSSISADLTSLLSKLEAEIAQDSQERDALTKRIEKNEKLRSAMKNALGGTSGSTGYGSKADSVRQAIQQISKRQFSQDDIEAEMKRVNPTLVVDRHHLRSALWSLANKYHYIRYAVKGNNRTPAVFERVHTAGNASTGPGTLRAVGSLVTNGAVLSVDNLEAFVREKNRRLNELTAHFGTDEATVRRFFDPTSQVYEATRGWIKIHDFKKVN